LYFAEFKNEPYQTVIFDNETNHTLKELITSINYSEDYNYIPLLSSYKGSLGAITIVTKLLEKTIINKPYATPFVTTILSAIDGLNCINDLNQINLEKYVYQSRKFYILSNILKKNYNYWSDIDHAKKVFKNHCSTDVQNEYLEYFNDCYESAIDKFLQLVQFCHKYNDDIHVDLVQLLKGSIDLFASSLIIDHSCNLKIIKSSKLIQLLELPENDRDHIVQVSVKNDKLLLTGIDGINNEINLDQFLP
jgi:hypothetical protein